MGRPKRESSSVTKAFADRLSDLVEEKKATGLSHNEICEQAGVGSGAMSDWLSDNKTANIDSLYKLAKYFNVSADYLLGISRATKAEYHNFSEMTHFSPATVGRLIEISGRARDEVCFKRYRVAFEYLLNSYPFMELLQTLCEYLDSSIPAKTIENFNELYINLDSRVCDLSGGNLHVVTSTLLAQTLLLKSQCQLADAFEQVKKDAREGGGWEQYM